MSDRDERWSPSERPYVRPDLRQQCRDGIAEGLARLRAEMDLIRDKAERKDARE